MDLARLLRSPCRGALAAALSAALLVSLPAHAGPLSLLSKAGKLASGSGKAAKAAAGASKAKTAMLAGGGVIAAERAGLLFKAIPDDVARTAVYVAGEPDGAYRLVTRAGEQATHAPAELGVAVERLGTEAKPGVDLYLDLTAARTPAGLPAPEAGRRWFVLDASGKPHPVRTETKADGTLQHFVDAGDVSLDLADFAALELEEDAEDGPPAWGYALAGVFVAGWGAVVVIRRRRRAKAEAEPQGGGEG